MCDRNKGNRLDVSLLGVNHARNQEAAHRQAKCPGQDRLGFESGPDPLQPGSLPKQALDTSAILTPFAELNAGDDLAGEIG